MDPEVVAEKEMTDEEYATLEKQYLSGEVEKPVEEKSEAPLEEETKESVSEDAEGEDDVREEGPAIKEAKRLREKNRELNEKLEKLSSMEQRYTELEAQVQALRGKPQGEAEKKDPVKEATMEQLVETEVALEEQLMDAYMSGDREQVKKLSSIKQRVRLELINRPKEQYKADDEEAKATSEWDALEREVLDHYPDLKDKDSDLQKSAQEFLKQRPHLAKKVGPLAGLLAVASTVLLQKKGKQSASGKPKDILEELEKVSQSSTKRTPGTTQPKHGKHIEMPDPDVDYDKAEAWFQKVKRGEIKIEGL